MTKQTGASEQIRVLARAVTEEFAGELPSWVVERIEAKVRRKQAEEPTARKSLVRKLGKQRESTLEAGSCDDSKRFN